MIDTGEVLRHTHPSEVMMRQAEAIALKGHMFRAAQQLLGEIAIEIKPARADNASPTTKKTKKPSGPSPGRRNTIAFEEAEWIDKAACKGLDPTIFFPIGEDDVDAEPAKAVCEGCPVVTSCLNFALTHRINEGIWGGATERERRRILKQRNGR